MDSESAVGYDVEDLFNPDLTAILFFQGTPRAKAADGYRKDNRFEEALIMRIERAVDEDLLNQGSSHGRRSGRIDWGASRLWLGNLAFNGLVPGLPSVFWTGIERMGSQEFPIGFTTFRHHLSHRLPKLLWGPRARLEREQDSALGHASILRIYMLPRQPPLILSPVLTAACLLSGHRTHRSADVLDAQAARPDGIENLAGLLGS
jgi:hypothetical protein